MRHFLAFILLTMLLIVPTWAGQVGMVVKVPEDGSNILVNRGTEDDVKPGTHWYIYRDNKPIAELEVELVDTYASYTRLVSGGGVRVGDIISDTPFTNAPNPKDFSPQTVAKESDVPTYEPKHDMFPSKRPDTTESINEDFDSAMSRFTKTSEFSGGNSKMRKTTANLPEIANLFTPLIGGVGAKYTGMFVVTDLANVVPQEMGTNAAAKQFFKGCKLKIETTWWSEELAAAYADTVAFKEGKTSPEERIAMRGALIAQKGLDRYIVFHVKMTNCGTGNVQLEPFHWHMFLADADGNRVKTERYDQILDKTLAPEQVVEGNVYFLRLDSAGQDITAGNDITVMYEDILAERAAVKFSSTEQQNRAREEKSRNYRRY